MESLRLKNQDFLKYIRNQIIYRLYKITIPFKVKKMRRKSKIRVVMVLSQLAFWKTENLYLAMKSHPRFSPILLLIPTPEREEEFARLQSYVVSRGYTPEYIAESETIFDKFHPDIIFYQQPYYGVINPKFDYLRNLRSLFCYVQYAFHTLNDEWLTDQPLFNFAWQLYFENDLTVADSSKVMYNKCRNAVVTGLPFVDDYMIVTGDPWKESSHRRKRIIWAPHHSIPGTGYLAYSTFIEYADFMIEMAEKYKDSVVFAFKPHPSLESKLERLWGKEKTREYYHKWESMDNTQIEYGEYVGLFKYSDAMIHDCVSFSVEYHYTKNPVMMLSFADGRKDNANTFGQMAKDFHYWGYSKADIEKFINDVIIEDDSMRDSREAFYNNYLLPKNGSACENIIKSVLGENA